MTIQRSWTDKRRRALEDWVEQVKPLLALSDWTIHYNWDGDEHTHPAKGDHPTALATMTPFGHSRHVTMSVSRELLHLKPEAQLQTLVHELCHCHLFSVHDYALDSFKVAGKDNELATGVFERGLNQQIETATDALADAFHRLVPPIDLS